MKSATTALSLLQYRQRQQLNVTEGSSSIHQLLEHVESTQNWTQSDSDDIRRLVTELEVEYVGQLDTQHQDDKTRWDQEQLKHIDCHTVAGTRFASGGDAHRSAQELGELSAKLEKCQQVDKAWDEYKLIGCGSGSSGGFPHAAQTHETLSKLTVLNTNVKLYAETLPTTSDDQMPSSCVQDRQKFEDKVCFTRAITLFACGAEKRCTAIVNLAGLKTELEQRATNRRLSKKDFLVVKCKIEAVLKKHNGTDWTPDEDCESNDETDEDYLLTLVVPGSPQCTDLTALTVYPSSEPKMCSDFLAEAYGNKWDATTHNIPTSCLANCEMVIEPPPKPTAPEGCTNKEATDAQCRLFVDHHDACTKTIYSTEAFVPVDQCCACGGGNPAMCGSVADIENFCGEGKLFDQGKANFHCASGVCTAIDVETCCEPRPPTEAVEVLEEGLAGWNTGECWRPCLAVQHRNFNAYDGRNTDCDEACGTGSIIHHNAGGSLVLNVSLKMSGSGTATIDLCDGGSFQPLDEGVWVAINGDKKGPNAQYGQRNTVQVDYKDGDSLEIGEDLSILCVYSVTLT